MPMRLQIPAGRYPNRHRTTQLLDRSLGPDQSRTHTCR
jgi:hypothetical protein